MHAIINDPPKPTTEYGVADSGLWTVIARGLSKSRDQRWSNMTEFGEALALWLYEHGIKEDLSGNSVRAVWLDSALSGVMVDLIPSAAPERHRNASSFSTSPAMAAAGATGASNPRFQPLVTSAQSTKLQALKPWALGLASALTVFGLAVALRPGRAPATPSSQTPSAPSDAKNARAPGNGDVASASPTASANPPAAAPTSEETKAPAASATPSRSAVRGTAPVTQQSPVRRPAAKRPTKAGLNRDFGF